MKRTYWVIGTCLSLLLVGGLAMDVSAQQTPPPAAAPSAPTETKPDSGMTQPSATPSPGGQMQQQPPSTNTQIESRTEKTTIVEREGSGSTIFGVDPMVALIVGAVVLVVIVIGLVAMSRRTEDVHHTHHRV